MKNIPSYLWVSFAVSVLEDVVCAQSKFPTGTGYQPSIPLNLDYSQCYDNNTTPEPFRLFSPDGFQEILNINGVPAVAELVSEAQTAPFYSFEAVSSLSGTGVYDLIYSVAGGNSYLGITEDGDFAFVSTSSQGTQFTSVAGQSKQFVTSIWSVTCDGLLIAGILNGPALLFGVQDGTLVPLTAPEIEARDITDTLTAPFRALKKWWNDHVSPDQARCPKDWQESRVKLNAPPNTPNGCGAKNGRSFPSAPAGADFSQCCNGHDLCFGDCTSKFLTCNDNFYNCMTQQCDTTFSTPLTLVFRSRCYNAAIAYAAAVGSSLGAGAYREATAERCDCIGCDTTNFAASPLFHKYNEFATEPWSECLECCSAWSQAVYGGPCACCIFGWQFEDPTYNCCSHAFNGPCCKVQCGISS